MRLDPDIGYVLGALTCVLATVAIVGVPGCVRHEVTAPQLDPMVAAVGRLAKPADCPRLTLGPVPEDVVLDIRGDRMTANTGGEQVLRGYVQCRSLFR